MTRGTKKETVSVKANTLVKKVKPKNTVETKEGSSSCQVFSFIDADALQDSKENLGVLHQSLLHLSNSQSFKH